MRYILYLLLFFTFYVLSEIDIKIEAKVKEAIS